MNIIGNTPCNINVFCHIEYLIRLTARYLRYSYYESNDIRPLILSYTKHYSYVSGENARRQKEFIQ
jgi:hypothetical protein